MSGPRADIYLRPDGRSSGGRPSALHRVPPRRGGSPILKAKACMACYTRLSACGQQEGMARHVRCPRWCPPCGGIFPTTLSDTAYGARGKGQERRKAARAGVTAARGPPRLTADDGDYAGVGSESARTCSVIPSARYLPSRAPARRRRYSASRRRENGGIAQCDGLSRSPVPMRVAPRNHSSPRPAVQPMARGGP